LNHSFSLAGANELTAQKLIDADPNTTRLVKKADAYFRVMPPEVPGFNHFAPAEWLFRNSDVLDPKEVEVQETLARAEKVIAVLNALLK
jgi:hypothetical protein